MKRMARKILLMACVFCLVAGPFAYAKEDAPQDISYTRVFEPETSWPMAATIAWRTGQDAVSAAGGERRPATGFVWLNKKLEVFDRDGKILPLGLDEYVKATSEGMIPAFYIVDKDTAEALKNYLQESSLQDCFVVSSPEHSDLVQDVADLPHVRGMLDFTGISDPDRKTLAKMAALVNRSHGKVVLLSQQAATRENVGLLQSLCSTVWALTLPDTKSLVTMYTNGVNGIVTDDFEAAIRAQEWFQDDQPSLLRVPLIIGHRGDPSTYAENTLYSALGAFAEGADSVENDIQLSSDGELFILHDTTPSRLLGIRGRKNAEEYTLQELQSRPFVWDDKDYGVLQNNEVSAENSRYGTLIGTDKTNRVPTLREFIETFLGSGLIHDTEIKSSNPDILPVYVNLVNEYDAWDQFFTITVNTPILDAVYENYPELSIGALGVEGISFLEPRMPAFKNYANIAEEEGIEAAVRALCGKLDQWNATYNPSLGFSMKTVEAARHRGLTVWPWTYKEKAEFAAGYVSGVSGLTTDYPWWASEYVVRILSEDVTVSSEEEIPAPTGITRIGGRKVLSSAELLILEDKEEDPESTLMIWRYRASIDTGEKRQVSYYLYSNPFTVTWKERKTRQ